MNMDKTGSAQQKSKFLGKIFGLQIEKKLIRYLIIGFSSFALEFSLLVILKEWAKIYYLYANSIAYIVVFCFNFLLNKFWSFNTRTNTVKQLVLYSILFFFNFCFNYWMMGFLTEHVGIDYKISKVIVVGMIVSWNFILYKKVIYK